MAHTDRDTTVVTTGSSGSGAGWFIAGILLAVLVGGVYAYSNGMIGGGTEELNISVELPAAEGAAE